MLEADSSFSGLLLQVVFHGQLIPVAIIFVLVLLLLLLSAVLEAGERCLTIFTPEEISQIKEEQSFNDKVLRQLIDRPCQSRTTILMVQLLLTLFVVLLSLYLFRLLFPEESSSFIFYFLFFVALFFLLFFVRGVLPKMMVRGGIYSFAYRVAPLLKFIDWSLRPLCIFFLMDDPSRQDSQGGESSLITIDHADEKVLMEEIVQFHDKTVEKIMVPRTDMLYIDIKENFKGVCAKAIATGYSRIPVFEEDEDTIVGILYVKDLLLAIEQPPSFHWQELIRPAYFVPESRKLDGMLEDFRTNKVHVAIIVDEFGCPSGLVTMEDVLEEIVGEITDEYDQEKKPFLSLPDGGYIFEGKIQLNDFFRITKLDEEQFDRTIEDVETLAGLLLNIKGTLPVRGEMINYNQFCFRVLDADERRVLKVKLFPVSPKNEEKNGG